MFNNTTKDHKYEIVLDHWREFCGVLENTFHINIRIHNSYILRLKCMITDIVNNTYNYSCANNLLCVGIKKCGQLGSYSPHYTSTLHFVNTPSPQLVSCWSDLVSLHTRQAISYGTHVGRHLESLWP